MPNAHAGHCTWSRFRLILLALLFAYGATGCRGFEDAAGKHPGSGLRQRVQREKQKQEIERRAAGQARGYSWDYDENYDIFAADLDGRNRRNLTNTRGYDVEARRRLGLPPPSRAPAGGRLAPRPAPPLQPPATAAEIRAQDIRAHVRRLAAPAMDGRMTGTAGERRAAGYIASVLNSYGLGPAGDYGAFFHSFDFTAGVSLGSGNRLLLRNGKSIQQRPYILDRDWRPLAFSKNGDFGPSRIVFAGYGIVAPAAAATQTMNKRGLRPRSPLTSIWI